MAHRFRASYDARRLMALPHFSLITRRPAGSLALGAVVSMATTLLACASPTAILPGGGANASGDDGGAATGARDAGAPASSGNVGPPGAGSDVAAPPLFSDAASGGPGGGPLDAPLCAEDIEKADRVPLDLLLLIDRSDSMLGLKWTMLTKALTSFLGDPRSAGLGVGLSFFPVAEVDHVCAQDVDCGALGATCVDRRVCAGADLSGPPPATCGGPGDAMCPGTAACLPLGECEVSGAYCTSPGTACPGDPGADLCQPLGKTCRMADFSESCTATTFVRPSVPIGPLPLVAPALLRVIAATTPNGGTPMAQAVQGTLGFLRGYTATHPTHHVALVLATDGVPSFCGDLGGAATPQDAVLASLGTAYRMTPPIPTYAIGVYDAVDGPAGPMTVNQIAAVGGTGMAFVLAPTNNLADQLLAALNQIRGSALPCAFTIPAPKGGTIDFAKVNVHFGGAGGARDIPYVGSAGKCDPLLGGWYYNVDPTVAVPTQVLVCDKTCATFKADPTGIVQIGFGCNAYVIK
jgi:hypothetical protein